MKSFGLTALGKTAFAAMVLLGTAMLTSAPAKADVAIGLSFGYDGGYFSDPCDYYDYYDQAPPWGLPPDYCDYPVYFEPVYAGGSWYRGPIYYRWYGGERMYWLNGGWRRDEWRGSRPSSIRWTDRGGWHGRGGWDSRGGWGSNGRGHNGWGNNGWSRGDSNGRSEFRDGGNRGGGDRGNWGNRSNDHGNSGDWNRGGNRGSGGFQGGGNGGRGFQGGGGRGGWSGGHGGGQGGGQGGGGRHGGH